MGVGVPNKVEKKSITNKATASKTASAGIVKITMLCNVYPNTYNLLQTVCLCPNK